MYIVIFDLLERILNNCFAITKLVADYNRCGVESNLSELKFCN